MHVDHYMHIIGWNMHVTCTLLRIGRVCLWIVRSLTFLANVALSRVKTLSGLHLVAFEDTSIRVSAGCIKEINRLRSCYRSDLPHIEVPVTRRHAKRKATGTSAVDGPPSKKIAACKLQ